jgi:membrane-bound lytic murein transglycosylase D
MRKIIYILAGTLCLLTACQTLDGQRKEPPPGGTVLNDATPDKTDGVVAPKATRTAPRQESVTKTAKSESETQASSYDDVWQRMGAQFSLSAPAEAKGQIAQYKSWYLKHPSHLGKVSRNAKPYLYLVVEELEKRKLPLELALLPIAESSYNPAAAGRGVAGLWQFTSATARNNRLPITPWYDARKDVSASTLAVIDMMERHYHALGKDWLKAFAAYHVGEGRVMNEVEKNRRRGRSTDFWSLELQRATHNYVPKLLALAEVIKDAKKYGIPLVPIANRPALKRVEADDQIDLALAANLAGMTTSELRSLNPGYTQWATPPSGPHSLLLPIAKAEGFTLALAKADKSRRLTTDRYLIRSGDSIGVIAKRLGVSVEALRALNQLKNDKIIAGKYLLVPMATGMSQGTGIAKASPAATDKSKVNYKVKSGDSLWTIAKRQGVTVDKLASWNKLSSKAQLSIGQNLVIYPRF